MNILKEFADFAATKSGEYQTEDCTSCPMAEFGLSLFPEAHTCSAGEQTLAFYPFYKGISDLKFPPNFFTKFVEPFHTWEDLTAALRRAVNGSAPHTVA